MKYLILLRGLPGSGKSTVAEVLSEDGKYPVCTADDYFMKDGKYCFDASKLRYVHTRCQEKAEIAMSMKADKIIIANTNTTENEFEPYIKMAEKYGYIVVSLIVENRHGGGNEHGVPEEKIQIMKERFDIKL